MTTDTRAGLIDGRAEDDGLGLVAGDRTWSRREVVAAARRTVVHE